MPTVRSICTRGLCILPIIALIACSPDEEEPAKPQLIIDTQRSTLVATVDPTFPQKLAFLDGHLAVGLENAWPDDHDNVSLQALELRGGSQNVEITGQLMRDEVTGRAAVTKIYFGGLEAKNEDLMVFCEETASTLHVAITSESHGSVSADIPVTLTCGTDRRAGELATRPLGANSIDRPCRIEGESATINHGWDAEGQMEIEEIFDVVAERRIIERDQQGRVGLIYSVVDGIIEKKTSYRYEGGRLVGIDQDDLRGDTSTTDVSWEGTDKVNAGQTIYQLTDGGTTLRYDDRGAPVTVLFGKPVDLTDYLTESRAEYGPKYEVLSREIKTRTGAAFTTFEYQDALIVGETITVNGSDVGVFTWKYTCP